MWYAIECSDPNFQGVSSGFIELLVTTGYGRAKPLLYLWSSQTTPILMVEPNHPHTYGRAKTTPILMVEPIHSHTYGRANPLPYLWSSQSTPILMVEPIHSHTYGRAKTTPILMATCLVFLHTADFTKVVALSQNSDSAVAS